MKRRGFVIEEDKKRVLGGKKGFLGRKERKQETMKKLALHSLVLRGAFWQEWQTIPYRFLGLFSSM